MKVFIIVVGLLAAAVLRGETPYTDRIRCVLEQIRREHTPEGLPLLRGCSKSYGGTHGTFFLLGPYVCSRATPDDVVAMFRDSSPVIRILAAKRVSMGTAPHFRTEILAQLVNDKTRVSIGPLDDETDADRTMTVAEVVQALMRDPHFMPLAFPGEEPNQSSQPTRPTGG